jgi:putative heme iron utilization protein
MDPYRPLDAEALEISASLLDANHGALATILDDVPFVSRAACLWIDGVGLTLLLSDLSEHARALHATPEASILLGDAGAKGDPLTHPRLTLVGRAEEMDKSIHAEVWRRDRPKTALYFDFTDFRLWGLSTRHALLNAGFGKAYRLTTTDLMSARRSAR